MRFAELESAWGILQSRNRKHGSAQERVLKILGTDVALAEFGRNYLRAYFSPHMATVERMICCLFESAAFEIVG